MQKRSVVSLVRVSGKAQIDRTGIPRQLEDIALLEEQYKLRIVGEYRFEGLSGAHVEQSPKFREMLSKLEDPNISGILFSDISRFFRPEFLDQYSILKTFRVHKKLMFCNEGELDVTNQQHTAIIQQAANAANTQRRHIKEWTSRGREIRRKQGDCKTDSLPAGVKFVPHPTSRHELPVGHFEYTHDFYSQRMVDAFNRIAAGDSQASVARDLKFGTPRSLRQALQSRWWIGEKSTLYKREGRKMRDDGTVYDGARKPRENAVIVKANFNEPPLIARAQWDAVQAILDNRHKTWVNAKSASSGALETFLGHGVLYCGKCGKKLYPKPVKRRHATTMYYLCSSNANYQKPCGLPMLHQSVVDRDIRVWAKLRLVNRNYLKTLKPAVAAVNTEDIQKQLRRAEKTLEARMRQIGEFENEALLQKLIKESEAQIRDLKKQLNVQPKPVSLDVDALRKQYLEFQRMPLENQKTLIKQTFTGIYVDATEDEDGNTGIDITKALVR